MSELKDWVGWVARSIFSPPPPHPTFASHHSWEWGKLWIFLHLFFLCFMKGKSMHLGCLDIVSLECFHFCPTVYHLCGTCHKLSHWSCEHTGVVWLHRSRVHEVKHLSGGARHAALLSGEILRLFTQIFSKFSLCFRAQTRRFTLLSSFERTSPTSCKSVNE